jgi:hypothetical protein
MAIGSLLLEGHQHCVLPPFIDFGKKKSGEIDPTGSLLKIATHQMCPFRPVAFLQNGQSAKS